VALAVLVVLQPTVILILLGSQGKIAETVVALLVLQG
jgi:hypothetical protein